MIREVLRPGRHSLRRLIVVIGGLVGLAFVGGSLLLLGASLGVRDELSRATDLFLEEQQIANGIAQGVMRQLASASAFSPTPDAQLRDREDFRNAGDEVYGQIRRYLFFDLSPVARIHLELMREEHEKLEVVAARTAELLARGEIEAGEASRAEMIEQAFVFLDSVDDFIRLRDRELETLRARQDRAFGFLLSGGVAASTFAGLTVLFLALLLHRRVARPLVRLGDAASRMAAGELGTRVPAEQDREFHVLAEGFNRMAESLQAATHDLEERNRELSTALDRVRETQAELIQTEKLSAMGRMAAGLAHELNNPLAGVLGFGELLDQALADHPDPAASRLRTEYVQPIVDEASRAQHLVRNFLHFSRRTNTPLGPVSLPRAVGMATTLREAAFRSAGLEIRIEDLPDVHVRADSHMLQSVLVNVVNNAFQAMTDGTTPVPRGGAGDVVRTPERPTVRGALTIRARTAESVVSLVLEDDGPGLQAPEKVFEPFFTTKAVGEGTGLGLAIAHRFMESFGGRIEAENRSEGGARFVLHFRRAEPGMLPGDLRVPSETQAPDVRDAGAGAAVGPDRDRGPAWEAEGVVEPGLRVLVVEDEEPLRRLQLRILSRLGARVMVAKNGAQARSILSKREIDLVVSDVRMPGESGISLYEWVVAERPSLADRFLFVTGDIGAPELAELADDRPELVLHKPFEIGEYISRIRRIMDRRPAMGRASCDPPFRSR